MPPSEIRKEARESLKGKWGKAVCIVLAYTLICFAIGFIQGFIEEESLLYSIIDLAYTIVSVPISFGLIVSFIKLKRSEDVSSFGFFKEGFSRFGKSWGIAWHTFIRLLLPIICLILMILLMAILIFIKIFSGGASISLVYILLSVVLYIATLIYVISRSFLFILAHYISYDNPDLSSKECVKRSQALMKGHRGNYFLLQLSFIGWAILAVLSLGIGLLWLAPYIAIAEVCFYERIVKPEVKKIDEEVKIEE